MPARDASVEQRREPLIIADVVRGFGSYSRPPCRVELRLVDIVDLGVPPADLPVKGQTFTANVACYTFTLHELRSPKRFKFKFRRHPDQGISVGTVGGPILNRE